MARGRVAGIRVERSELTSLSDVRVAFARFMAAWEGGSQRDVSEIQT